VQFAFNGSTVATVTDAAGQGSAIFFAGISTGTQLFTAQFDGNGTYAAVNGTGTVTVTVRPTTLVAYNIADAIVLSSCTARVEFRDNTSNAGIAGAEILFAFQGTSMTVLTDGTGAAACSFATPASSGTYFYTATFVSDGIYAANEATGTVTVSKRHTMIFMQNISVRSATAFTAEGRLVDVATQQGIPGMELIFEFLGSSLTTASNGSGVSTTTFAAPAATGTYVMTVTFPTETETYYAAQATAAVTVGLEFAYLVAADAVQVPIKDTVVLSATLSDSVGTRLANMPVTFTVWGTELTGITNGVGVATAAATAWGVVTATGSYPYAAEFRGDTTYLAAADTQNVVNVQMRHTLMTAKYIQTAPSTAFTAEAVLYDNVNGSPLAGTTLAGMPVQFSFYTGVTTVTVAGVTDGVGRSTAAFTAPAATGTYHYDAVFAGDARYVASSDTETVHVVVVTGEGIGTMVNTTPVQAYITAVFTASATLTATGFPVPSKAIDFTFFNGVSTATATAYTDAFGIAQTTFAASALYGAYQYQAAYIGDLAYAPSEDASAVTISRYPVDLVAIDTAALAGATFTATAVLTDARTFAKLNNKTIQFEFVGTTAVFTASAVTDSSGTAVVPFPAPLQYGIYSFGARFAGDADYAGLVSSGSVVIVSDGQDTFLAMENLRAGVGELFIATATLTCKGYPVRGKAIQFSFCGETAVSTTSASGTAAVTFTAPASSGSYTCTAAFIGDVDYKGASCEATVDAVIRECPADPNPVTIVRGADSTVTITWPAVVYTNGHIKGYMVEGTRNFRGAWEPIEFIYSTAPALSLTRSVAADDHCYFRVKSVSWNKDQESNGLVIVELPDEATAADEGSAANHIFLSEDHNAWVTIPEQLMENIYTHDGSTVPLQVAVVKEEQAQFLLSYDVTVRDADGKTVPEFKFTRSRRGIRLEFSYDQLPARSAARTQAVNNQVAIFWYNGVEWIKLGGTNDVIGKTCTLYTLKTGKFALGLAQAAESFTVNKVAPRIFTPEETVTLVNRVRFYFENPDAVEVSIRIFDATGALVRRNLAREGDNIMFWDGRDNDGTVVRGGVYLYQIEAGNAIITGTVVVAK
jgi:hypothetical protein